jgi:aminoglycoside phosphotransferase (APT) family kinase protein
MGEPVGPPEVDMHRSSRDPEQLRPKLEAWLGGLLPAGADPKIPELEATSANGMSSETVLLTASWTDDGEQRQERLVARVAPDPADVPVFPEYDLQSQFDVIRMVGELTSVPVPKVRWSDASGAATGVPLFVMERVDGLVPPDVMPYTFGDNWLFDATPEQQRTLQDSSVAVLADLHRIENAENRFSFLALDDEEGDTPLARRVSHTQAWYDYARDGHRSELIEEGFRWLDEHWPEDEGSTVVAWGDSRIGNVMYRDFKPCAVLDWEMAALGPRELDLAWMIYAHAVFEDLARVFELPGMPHFMRRDDVASAYESMTGHTPRDLDFYTVYAAVQWGIVFVRTGLRAVHFGEEQMPADVDQFIRNADSLERMLAGTYWS